MKFKNIAAQETSSIHKLFEDNQKVHIKLAKIYQTLSIVYPEDSTVWRELYIDEMNFFVNLFSKLRNVSNQDLLEALLISQTELKQVESHLDQLAKKIRYRSISKTTLYALLLKIEIEKDSFHNRIKDLSTHHIPELSQYHSLTSIDKRTHDQRIIDLINYSQNNIQEKRLRDYLR